MHLHFSCEHHLCDPGAADSLIIQGKLWVFCQVFGRALRADPRGTHKITPQQDKASPLLLGLCAKGNLSPLLLSFSAPESPRIPSP